MLDLWISLLSVCTANIHKMLTINFFTCYRTDKLFVANGAVIVVKNPQCKKNNHHPAVLVGQS